MTDAALPPVITDVGALADLCAGLASSAFVALDTEFVRDRTYHPRLCLVQLATPDTHALIDPIAVQDLAPLRDLLLAQDVLKVLHAARQDLELFHHLWGAVPSPVFDTQVAAAVAGLGDQVSYASLVRDLVGVSLHKGSTLTDWTRRPLTREQLEYAAADVVHLVPAYLALSQRLEARGRTRWLEREMAALTDPRLHAPDPSRAWESVKSAGSVRGSGRGVLRALAAWREEEAQRRDVPRRWVLSDDLLVSLARRPPRSLEDLRSLRTLPEGVAQRSGEALLSAVRLGLEARHEPAPEAAPPTDEQRAVADLMSCLLRLTAKEHGVAPAALASRADVERVAIEGAEADVPLLSGWRREMAGEDLLALRDGRLQLVVEGGAVTIVRG